MMVISSVCPVSPQQAVVLATLRVRSIDKSSPVSAGCSSTQTLHVAVTALRKAGFRIVSEVIDGRYYYRMEDGNNG